MKRLGKLLLGGVLVLVRRRRREDPAPAALSEAERARLDELLKE